MKDATGQYLNRIGQVPLLDAAQEQALARKIEAGRDAQARLDSGETNGELRRAARDGSRAKNQFIQANLRLVVNVARRYPVPPGMELLDLIQEGNLGLEHAVDKFDWRRGFKFSTYATFWIRQAISRALDQKGNLIRLPGERAAGLRAALRSTGGDEEGLDAEQAELHRLTSVASLDRSVSDDGETQLGDFVTATGAGPEATVVSEAYEHQAVGLLEALDPTSRRAVALRVGLPDGRPRSYREIGEAIGTSADAASRLVRRAYDRLRGAASDLELAA